MFTSRRTFPLLATLAAALLTLTGAASAHAAVQIDSPYAYANPGTELNFSGATDGGLVDIYAGTTGIDEVTADPTGRGSFPAGDLPATLGQNVALQLRDVTTGDTADLTFNQVPTVTTTGTGRDQRIDVTSAIPDGNFNVYVDGGYYATVQAEPDGTETLDLGELPGNAITAATLDGQDNESDRSAPVMVDNVAPDAPTVDSPATDSILTTTRPDVVVSGAEAGSTVKVYSDAQYYGQATVPVGGGNVTVHGNVDLPQDLSWLTATATDADGNESDPSDGVSVTVDTIAPAAAPHIQEQPGDVSSATRFGFYTDSSDDTAQCRVADDASTPWTVCQDSNGSGGFEPQLADGRHTVEIREIDEAGNASQAESFTWTLDTIAPGAATITGAPDATTANTTATFAFTAEPGASFICDLDGNPGMQHSDDCDSPRTYTGLAVGTHTFKVWALDAAGNGSAPSEYTFTVTAPSTPTTPTTPTNPTPPTNPTNPAATLTHVKLSQPALTKRKPVKVSFTVNKPGTVTMAITLALKGHGKTKKVGTITLHVKKAGRGSYLLRTKIGRRTLRKGRYTLTLLLTAGSQHSKPVTEKLTVR